MPKAPKQLEAKSEQEHKVPSPGLGWPTGAALLVSPSPGAMTDGEPWINCSTCVKYMLYLASRRYEELFRLTHRHQPWVSGYLQQSRAEPKNSLPGSDCSRCIAVSPRQTPLPSYVNLISSPCGLDTECGFWVCNLSSTHF